MNTEELLQRYEEGKRNFSGVDLSGVNVSFEDLSNINLAGANLSKAKLAGTKLENANFQNANLRGVDLSCDRHGNHINFSGADFRETGLYEGIIEKADFSSANFSNASIAQYLMTECNFSDTDFTNAWISETDLSQSNLTGAIFRQAHIDINFFDANIFNADFSHTIFFCSPKDLIETRGIDVSTANFTNAIFFVKRLTVSSDFDISAIQGAICVSSPSDLDNLDLSKYNTFAVENMMEYFNQYSSSHT